MNLSLELKLIGKWSASPTTIHLLLTCTVMTIIKLQAKERVGENVIVCRIIAICILLAVWVGQGRMLAFSSRMCAI